VCVCVNYLVNHSTLLNDLRQEMIGSEFQKISERNAQLSEKKCYALIEKLHQAIRDKVDANYYYRIGGYNDYQQDVGAMVREYLQAPGKGVKVHSQCYIHVVWTSGVSGIFTCASAMLSENGIIFGGARVSVCVSA